MLMKERIKTIVAFLILAAITVAGFYLDVRDQSTDVYPNENTTIMLYGEVHGDKAYYDAEFTLWKGYYEDGCRDLFVELPYYSAEFLNLWMREETDEILDELYEDIQGTQSGNENYLNFIYRIKSECPETVFHGTDVGHQFETTGLRYIAYLTQQGLIASENYRLAQECIRQGKDYYKDDSDRDGISEAREAYMTSNFITAYERCGGKVMGIYGSYHTVLSNPQRMAGRLHETYGDAISGVNLGNYILQEKNKPYRFGLCFSGVIVLLMLFIPNIIWGVKGKPKGYETVVKRENKVLLTMERVGEAMVSCFLVIFPASDPHFLKLSSGGIQYRYKIIMWMAAMLLMILYDLYWIKYFKSERRLQDFYASFAGFPLAGASLPVIAVTLLGLYSGNLILLAASIILGIGHIGIHYSHRQEIALDEKI